MPLIIPSSSLCPQCSCTVTPPMSPPPLPLANECVGPEPLISAFKTDAARQAVVMSELLQMLFHPPFFL